VNDNCSVWNNVLVFVIWDVVYLLPVWIVLYNRHRQRMFIAAINLFFGWTVVLWLVTLVWACIPGPKRLRLAK
jgi:hypothetical protein